MGIAERKAASQFEESVYPKLKKEIDAAAHFEVPVEVDWATLAIDASEHLYEEAWTKVYFTPLIGALKAIAVDELGREVLRGALKRVVLQNVSGAYSGSSMVRFQDGVLTLDHAPTTNVDDIGDRQEAIRKALEAAPEEDSAAPEDPLAAFLSWNARGVDGLLHVLQRIFWRQQAGIPLLLPRMTLLLRSGRSVTGIMREILEDRREGRAALVYVPRESGIPYEEAVIVPVGTIEAISIQDAPAFGALRRDAPPIPSQLQLRRRLAALETQLRGLLETAVTVKLSPEAPTSAADLRSLGFLTDRTREVLEALGKDKIGRAALREKVQRIHLSVGEDSSVTLADHALTLVNGRRPVDWQTRQELEQAVQSAL